MTRYIDVTDHWIEILERGGSGTTWNKQTSASLLRSHQATVEDNHPHVLTRAQVVHNVENRWSALHLVLHHASLVQNKP